MFCEEVSLSEVLFILDNFFKNLLCVSCCHLNLNFSGQVVKKMFLLCKYVEMISSPVIPPNPGFLSSRVECIVFISRGLISLVKTCQSWILGDTVDTTQPTYTYTSYTVSLRSSYDSETRGLL
jgi:hypothetical protein